MAENIQKRPRRQDNREARQAKRIVATKLFEQITLTVAIVSRRARFLIVATTRQISDFTEKNAKVVNKDVNEAEKGIEEPCRTSA